MPSLPPSVLRSKGILAVAGAACAAVLIAVMSCGDGGGSKTGAGGRGGASSMTGGKGGFAGAAMGGAGGTGAAAGAAGAQGGRGGSAGAGGAAGGTGGAAGRPGAAGGSGGAAGAGAGGAGGGGGGGGGAGGTSACGTVNRPCCGDVRTCDPGLRCQGGGAMCVVCGRKGDLCCPVAGGAATGCNAGFKCVDFQGDDLPRCADCTNAARFICSTGQTCVDDSVQGPQCTPSAP